MANLAIMLSLQDGMGILSVANDAHALSLVSSMSIFEL